MSDSRPASSSQEGSSGEDPSGKEGSESDQKTEQLRFRVTPARKRQLKELADRAGLSMTGYVERLIRSRWSKRGDETRKVKIKDASTDLLEVMEDLREARRQCKEMDTEAPQLELTISGARDRMGEVRQLLLEAYDE
jgi:molecular chaperone GrpE (heat shock protein)